MPTSGVYLVCPQFWETKMCKKLYDAKRMKSISVKYFLNFQPEECYAVPSKIKPRCNYVNIDPHSHYIPMYGRARKNSKRVRSKVRRCVMNEIDPSLCLEPLHEKSGLDLKIRLQ